MTRFVGKCKECGKILEYFQESGYNYYLKRGRRCHNCLYHYKKQGKN